jgi:hypothetical protein
LILVAEGTTKYFWIPVLLGHSFVLVRVRSACR